MSNIEQAPVAGEIVNTEWVDAETYMVEVEQDGELFRERYTFESVEKVDPEDI